jgi:DNA-binding NarL/FixJ family response regulator
MSRLRIVVADDHEVVRRGIRSLIETRSGWEVCAEASTGTEAIHLVKKLKPDIILLDVSMPDLNGIEVARELRAQCPTTEILILTMHETPSVVGEALAAGARGMVYKSDAGKDLLNAIEAVSRKKAFVSAHVTEMIVKSGVPRPAELPGLAPLTERELEVLKMLAQGKNVKEIAADLNISPKTVNVHRANIMEKLQLHSLHDLIYFAIRNKIIEV